MTNEWNLSPLDYRNLLNPAFCGLLLTRAAKEYEESSGRGMALPLMFLVLPLAVPSHVRSLLPTNSASSFPAWIHSHPEVRIGLAEHAREMVHLTRQAILFCIQRRALAISRDQLISSVPRRMSASDELERESPGVEEMVRKARFVGRWFARSGEATTIYYLLGIQP